MLTNVPVSVGERWGLVKRPSTAASVTPHIVTLHHGVGGCGIGLESGLHVTEITFFISHSTQTHIYTYFCHWHFQPVTSILTWWKWGLDTVYRESIQVDRLDVFRKCLTCTVDTCRWLNDVIHYFVCLTSMFINITNVNKKHFLKH